MALQFASLAGIFLAVTAAFLAYVYWVFSRFDYWEKRGVPYPTPTPFVGNFGEVFSRKVRFGASMRKYYMQFRDHGYCGIYQWKTPLLLVYDPDLIKQVLTKDFSSFHDRGLPHDEQGDPLTGNLFNLEGQKWKNLRRKLSPTFTSGKLKLMFPLMKDVSAHLSEIMRDSLKQNEVEMDLKDLLLRYSTDLIGTCAFGMECNALKDKNDDFQQMARKMMRTNIPMLFRFFLATTVHPKAAKLVPFKIIFPETHHFFTNLMKNTVEYREKNKVERNDFVNLMLQLREQDKEEEDHENNVEFSVSVMTAQAVVFFIAGLDSVANTVAWALHELVLNPELQQRAAEEVRAVIKEHGELSYEALKKMTLIECIINESLRKYTPISPLFRKASNNVQLSSNLTLAKGTVVHIPIDAIHHDPVLYPDPERFDPSRWTEEEKQMRHPYAFLPFGEGPRLCIAERFARVELYLCLAHLLNDFQFSMGDKFEKNPVDDVAMFGPTALNGFWFKVAER